MSWILAASSIVSESSCWWHNLQLFTAACLWENDFHLHVWSTNGCLWMYCYYVHIFRGLSHSIHFRKVRSFFQDTKYDLLSKMIGYTKMIGLTHHWRPSWKTCFARMVIWFVVEHQNREFNNTTGCNLKFKLRLQSKDFSYFTC